MQVDKAIAENLMECINYIHAPYSSGTAAVVQG